MENININNLATKDDLKEVRNEMATKKDMERFATKFELDIKIDNVKDELKDEIHKMGDKLTKGNDDVIKELREMRSETAAHSLSYKQHEEVLDDYEKRINVLELKPAI